jgi:hypothetical protein
MSASFMTRAYFIAGRVGVTSSGDHGIYMQGILATAEFVIQTGPPATDLGKNDVKIYEKDRKRRLRSKRSHAFISRHSRSIASV